MRQTGPAPLASKPDSITDHVDLGPAKILWRQSRGADEVAHDQGLSQSILVLQEQAYEKSSHRRDGRSIDVAVPAGAVDFIPAGMPFRWSWESGHTIRNAHLCFEPGVFEAVWGDLELGTLVARRGPRIQRLGALLVAEAARPAANRLYVDTVSTALVRLIGEVTRGQAPATEETSSRPLDTRRLGRVLEALRDRASTRVTLEELGEVADLSPFSLCRRFKATVGETPHRYQLKLRVADIRAALEDPRDDRTLAEIALDHGFADQAHMSRTFARYAGTPPARYRQTARAAG